jgi:hypothetical protein
VEVEGDLKESGLKDAELGILELKEVKQVKE